MRTSEKLEQGSRQAQVHAAVTASPSVIVHQMCRILLGCPMSHYAYPAMRGVDDHVGEYFNLLMPYHCGQDVHALVAISLQVPPQIDIELRRGSG
jgi:hypothetical protein